MKKTNSLFQEKSVLAMHLSAIFNGVTTRIDCNAMLDGCIRDVSIYKMGNGPENIFARIDVKNPKK